MKVFLFDIEGTTTDISFVHKVLFPYSKERMKDFVLENLTDPKVKAAVEQVKETVLKEEHIQLTNYEVVNRLEQWIAQDRKHGALKEIQGFIWQKGYEAGHFQGHVYPDVKPFFEKLLFLGKTIAIYSSGSVQAQKLIFGYSSAGDLSSKISSYFDTNVGGKREAKSYETIAEKLQQKPNGIVFFSDIPEELEAAQAAGLNVIQVLREGTRPSTFPSVKSFEEFKL